MKSGDAFMLAHNNMKRIYFKTKTGAELRARDVKYIKSGNKGAIVKLLLSYLKRLEATADDRY
jgi:hypothetical protein